MQECKLLITIEFRIILKLIMSCIKVNKATHVSSCFQSVLLLLFNLYGNVIYLNEHSYTSSSTQILQNMYFFSHFNQRISLSKETHLKNTQN